MVAEPVTSDSVPAPAWRRIGGGKKLWRSTRVCDRRLLLSSDIYERLGKPRFVGILIGQQHAAIALRAAASRAPGADLYKVERRSGGSVTVSIAGALKALGRTWAETTTSLPHHWADGALIVDISPLPLAGGA